VFVDMANENGAEIDYFPYAMQHLKVVILMDVSTSGGDHSKKIIALDY